MDKFIYNEINGLRYELQGDYYLPCLKLPKKNGGISAYGDSGLSFFNVFHRACIIFKPVLDTSGGGYAILYHDTIYSAGKEYLSLNTSTQSREDQGKSVGACLDCFVEKGLMQALRK